MKPPRPMEDPPEVYIPHTWGTMAAEQLEDRLPDWLARFLRVPIVLFGFGIDVTLTLWRCRYDAVLWLFALTVLALMLLPGCATSNGAGLPFVGFATAEGNGDLRTDGDVYLMLGEWTGDAGIFLQGSGFPVTLPLDGAEDEWRAVRRSTKEKLHGKLGVDPLPAWTASLFRPGELEALSLRFGKTLSIADPSP